MTSDNRGNLSERLRPASGAEVRRLQQRVEALENSVSEAQRLNERLSDVLDVVVELLVPAVDRDDERLNAALDSLGKKLPR